MGFADAERRTRLDVHRHHSFPRATASVEELIALGRPMNLCPSVDRDLPLPAGAGKRLHLYFKATRFA